jgi:hypothetical protein
MLRADASTFPICLECCRREGPDAESPAQLRLTVIEIDRIRQAEAEMRAAGTLTPGGG